MVVRPARSEPAGTFSSFEPDAAWRGWIPKVPTPSPAPVRRHHEARRRVELSPGLFHGQEGVRRTLREGRSHRYPSSGGQGGAGGGTGHDEKGQEGEGGGFGMSGRPAGAYVVKDGKVKWLPAVDPNRVFLMVGMAVIAYLLMRPRMARARAALASPSATG